MLRNEGNKRGRVAGTLLAIVAVMLAWIASPATASAAQGTVQWHVTGPQGGPFTPTQGTFDIQNTWNAKLRWYAIGDTSWLRFSGFNGMVQPGATKTVNVELITSVAEGMPKGDYKAYVAFRDPATGKYAAAAELILSVGDAPPPPPGAGQLDVTPAEGLTSQGPEGGPFSPLSKTYTLKNSGDAPLNWKATFDSDWVLTPGPASGQLQPGASQPFEVRLDANLLGSMAVGQYSSRVRFHDLDQGVEVTTREVSLDVKSGSSGSGWTTFTKSADTRVVYVSSSKGNDANDGLSEATPKRTIGAGKALLRNGFPDWLLLKKGDGWNEDLGVWSLSGRSISEPMLVSSYGAGPRPVIRPAAGNNGISVWDPYKPQFVALVDLHFVPQSSPTDGRAIAWYSDCGPALVEGCLLEGFDIAFLFQGGRDIVVRRNVAYNNDGQGGYIENVTGFLFEENVVDRSGFPDPNYYKHALYIDNEGMSGVVVRNNIVTEASSNGIYLRPGGICENNLVARCGIGIEIGGGDSWYANAGGVTADVRNNVVLDGKDINSSQPRGWGMLMQNIASAKVEGNVIANIGNCGFPFGIEIDGWANGSQVYNITLRANTIYGWQGECIRIKGNAGEQVKNLTIDSNDFQNDVDLSSLLYTWDPTTTAEIQSGKNRFFSVAPSGSQFILNGSGQDLAKYKAAVGDTSSQSVQADYPYAKAATIPGYHAALGRASSHEAFMTEARKQCRDLWRVEYTAQAVNDWIRSGFGK